MNEIVTIVGYRHVSFKGDEGGNVTGYQLYYECEPGDNSKTVGLMTGKQFISDTRCDYIPAPGDRVIFRYNKYGKIGSVEVV